MAERSEWEIVSSHSLEVGVAFFFNMSLFFEKFLNVCCGVAAGLFAFVFLFLFVS
jgi:hypothetical protein